MILHFGSDCFRVAAILKRCNMSIIKFLARVLLVLLMIGVGFQMVLTGLGIFAAVGQRPEAISYMLGRFVGSLLFMILFVWCFRKLGTRR